MQGTWDGNVSMEYATGWGTFTYISLLDWDNEPTMRAGTEKKIIEPEKNLNMIGYGPMWCLMSDPVHIILLNIQTVQHYS